MFGVRYHGLVKEGGLRKGGSAGYHYHHCLEIGKGERARASCISISESIIISSSKT